MKKALFIFLLTAISVLCAAAQTDFDEPKWTKFQPEREEFTVDLPGPKVVALNRDYDSVKHAEYHIVLGKSYFAIFSEADMDSSVLRQLMGLVSGDAAPKDVEIDGHKGQRYDFKGSDDYQHSFIAIQASAHFYIFHAISEVAGDSVSEQFLASVKLDREVSVTENAPTPPVVAPVVTSTASRSDILKKPSAGSGNPGGFGQADENGIAPPKHARIDSPVTILFKPAAGYTNLARRYMISGTIRLRVTFEKDGTISNITVLAKLPMGLTQSAISAARQIRFSPELRSGDPYSAAKVVEYNFTLY